MKKYLGILLIMIGMVIIPGNVKASMITSMGCGDVSINSENRKETKCTINYSNESEENYAGGYLLIKMEPSENTTTTSIELADNLILNKSYNNMYFIQVGEVVAGGTGEVGSVSWLADSFSENPTGEITFEWLGANSDKIIEPNTFSSSNLTINYLEEKTEEDYGKVFNVEIKWGTLEYDYVKFGEYVWKPVINESGVPSNTVNVINNSNIDISAQINFEAAIEGVEANYRTYLHDIEDVENTSAEVDISAPFEITNEYGTYTQLGSVTWMVDLIGGSYEDIQEVYNSEERKIGTLTITISESLGDIG